MKSPEAPYKNSALSIDERVEDLLPRMSMQEKIGQLNQVLASPQKLEEVRELARRGLVGSRILSATAWAGNEAQHTTEIEEGNIVQRIALEESRLGIPILFGRDIIHGHRTIFPMPLAQAASWDPELVEQAASHAAREAAAYGVHWTFAPMVDLARDPRWGRVVEGPGEDPFLGGVMATAQVRGFQGEDPSQPGRLLACAKHFVGYGTSEGGRDYAGGECSDHTLRNAYLEPFRKAVQAGAASVMSAFHDLNGVPISGSRYLLTELLKEELGFDGFVVSDWDSVTELILHGFAEDRADAAGKALMAGVDMEMVSGSFIEHLEQELANGRVSIERIDDAVRRILRAKFRKGLFERPYVDVSRAQAASFLPEARACARQLAARSCVLLKNQANILPLPKRGKRIAVVGPLATARRELLGSWVLDGNADDVVSIADAIREAAPDASVSVSTAMLDQALFEARRADVVVAVVGESWQRTGEACNIADLALPPDQEALIVALDRIGVPIVTVVCAARPLPIGKVVTASQAVLYAWHPGVEGGRAIADLLFGDQNPSGKLPITIPRSGGQVPIYYCYKNGGRSVNAYYPFLPSTAEYVIAYQDERSTPLFPFGFGLSYTSFEYCDFSLDRECIGPDEVVNVTVTVRNAGERAGFEIVQCYIRDVVATVTRPVRELKAFSRIHLEPGQSARVEFALGPEQLAFWNNERARVVEPGRFEVFVGPNAYTELGGAFSVR